MAFRPPRGPRGGRGDYPRSGATPPRGGRSSYMPDSNYHEVPYYQDTRDMARHQHYDTYAFANPNSYNDWNSSGQRSWTPPRSAMPQPREHVYRPPAPQYSSFSAAGPSNYRSASHSAGLLDNQQSRSYSNTNRGGAPTSPRGSYLPPHKRGQAQSPSPSYTPPSGSSLRDRTPNTTPFVIPLPDREYMNLSKPHIPSLKARTVAEAPKKLLVLDLNGTLIFRNKNSSNSRTSYPRPYLKSFLNYLLQKEEEGDLDGLGRWSVFVWSSAQPHNVRGMLESTFDPRHIEGLWDKEGPDKMASVYEKGKVLGVWARDKMGLSAHEYANKTQTVKDLRNVAELFTSLEAETKTRFRLQDILLLDDSPKKAVHQPWNQLVLPEYDKPAWQQSREAVARSRTGEPGSECDQYLLAIIGILEDLTTVSNIPAYIRAGGLKKPSVSDYAAEWAPSGRWQGVADGPAADETPTLAQLPSHEEFSHWFQDQAVVDQWIAKGKEALEERGIPFEHGVRLDIASSQSPAPSSPRASRRTSRAPTPGHTVPAQRRRGYSPSQPTQATGDATVDEDLAVRARRSLSLDNQSRPILNEHRAKSPLSRDHRPTTEAEGSSSTANGQTRSFTTLNPNPNITFAPVSEAFDPSRPVDTWRTLRSADVSRWIADVADRASSIDQQARTLLLHAGELVRTLGTDETWDRRMPAEMLRMGGWQDNMSDGDLATIGEVRALSQTRDMVEQASANGMPACSTWSKYGSGQLGRSVAGLKRYMPVDEDGQPVMKKKKAKLVFNAVNAGHTADEIVEIVDIRPRGPRAPPPTNAAAELATPDLIDTSLPANPAVARPGSVATSVTTVQQPPDHAIPDLTASGSRAPLNVDDPLDYPTKRLGLPPCKVHGKPLTEKNLVKILHQASQSTDAEQAGRLQQIRDIERLVRQGGRKEDKNVKSFRRAQSLRDQIVREVRNLPETAVKSQRLKASRVSFILYGIANAPEDSNGPSHQQASPLPDGSHPVPPHPVLPTPPDTAVPLQDAQDQPATNGHNSPEDPSSQSAVQPVQSRPFNYRWCILDLPPCRLSSKIVPPDEAIQLYEKARKRPSTSQTKRLREIRTIEDRINSPSRSDTARQKDMAQAEFLRNEVVRVEREHEKQKLAKKTNGVKARLKNDSGNNRSSHAADAGSGEDRGDDSDWQGSGDGDEPEEPGPVQWDIRTRSQRAQQRAEDVKP